MLPASISVSGAGTASANGTYSPLAGANAVYNGATQYTNGTNFIAYNSNSIWGIFGAVNAAAPTLYDAPGSGQTAAVFPPGPWTTVISGTAPTPNVTVPAAAPLAPAAPTFGATTTGVSSLAVHTQGLTGSNSNNQATAETIKVTTDAAGNTQIAGSPFAAPTPGADVSVPLVSGNSYYVWVGMSNTAGMTYGPSTPVNFDVTGPVLTSGAIQPSGNAVVFAHSEFSPPLQGNGGVHTLSLTGGPVALSAPVYAAATITYTTSRTIYAGETGTFSVLAGAFKDSASPTNNLSPAIAAQAITNNSTAQPPVASAAKHVFSTGTLVANWLDGGGNPQAATFALLQDVSTDLTYSRKDLFDAQVNSVFPVDAADAEGKLVLKASQASISADCLQRLIAATLTAAAPGSTAQLVLPRSVKLPSFQAVLTLFGTDGKPVTLTAGAAKALGTNLALKFADFVVNGFELHCYPDANNVIATWAFAN